MPSGLQLHHISVGVVITNDHQRRCILSRCWSEVKTDVYCRYVRKPWLLEVEPPRVEKKESEDGGSRSQKGKESELGDSKEVQIEQEGEC